MAVAARRVDRLDDLVCEIEEFEGRAMAFALNVGDRGNVRQVVADTETELGAISVLLDNADIMEPRDGIDVTEADFDRVICTDLKGAWLVAQETGRHMIRMGQGGSIINTASIRSFLSSLWAPAY